MNWRNVEKNPPPVNTPIWGFDMFHGGISLVDWDGERKTDDGDPFLCRVDDPEHDDHYFKYWHPAEIPQPPKFNKEGFQV